ncbi:MAG: PHP domain-containing protein [Limnospira sp.]
MSVNLAPASAGFPRFSPERGFARNPSARSGASSQPPLTQVFKAIDADSCPTSYNFHIHTTKSDGQLDPIAVIQQAIAIGLRGLAITDHHTTEGYRAARYWLEQWKVNHPEHHAQAPTLWTGIEINAGLLKTDVHILGYGFDADSPSLLPYLRGRVTRGQEYAAKAVISAIQAAGGIAVLAHPARYRRPAAELIPEADRLGIDGVEVYYSYRHTKPWRPSPNITEQMKALAKTHNLMQTCGTDTHGTNILLRL